MNNAPPTTTQAQAVFAKFGGVKNLQQALLAVNPAKKWSISGIYKWDLPKEKQGTGGLIPSQALRDVIKAARHEGVLLTSDDLYPAEKR